MNRFGNISSVTINEIIKNRETNKLSNTLKTEQYVWRQFKLFCDVRKYLLNVNTSNEQIAEILKDWAFNMRKIDGTEYKEGVVKTMWNITANMVQKKYYNEFSRTFDPFKDIVFQVAVNAKTAKRKELKVISTRRKRSAVVLNPADIYEIVDTLDEDNPYGLQRKFYHLASLQLGWSGGEAVSCVLDYFKDEIDADGAKTGRIEYNSVFTTTSQGGSTSKWLTPNTQNFDYCPVRLWRALMSKRTANIKTGRLFLSVNKDWNKHFNSCWYKNMPLGINEINKWTNLGAKVIGLDTKRVKITNYSNKSTKVSHLSRAGTSEQITDLNTANSYESHLRFAKEEHDSCDDNTIFFKTEDDINVESTFSSLEPSKATTNVYRNCTFNINTS